MSCDHRRERILGRLGSVLLWPIFALYCLWVAGGRIADRRGQRRR